MPFALDKIFKRQTDLVNPKELTFPILVIGAGGIGSWTVLTLAKMGCSNITVVDPDKVELHNLPSQFYLPDQVGQNKVDALQANVEEFTGVKITALAVKFEKYSQPINEALGLNNSKVIICAVDSLKTRQKIWEILRENTEWDCFIDARMGGEVLRIFVVNSLFKPSMDKYEKSLNTKAKEHEEPCTGRAIVYNTQIAGGLVANIVKKYAKHEETKLAFTVDMIQQEIV